MSYRYDEFSPGEIYHVFTRGVEKRNVFLSDQDRQRFLDLLVYYAPQQKPISFSAAVKLKRKRAVKDNEGKGLIDLLCYCLMDNHVHLLLYENIEKGISTYIQRVLSAYARYFNMKYRRSGSLFLHPFKAVLVDADEQFMHVSRYIHLNPHMAQMVDDPFAYQWYSLGEYITPKKNTRCHTSLLQSMLPIQEHMQFITNEADYLRSLEDIEHLLIDNED